MIVIITSLALRGEGEGSYRVSSYKEQQQKYINTEIPKGEDDAMAVTFSLLDLSWSMEATARCIRSYFLCFATLSHICEACKLRLGKTLLTKRVWVAKEIIYSSFCSLCLLHNSTSNGCT